MFLLLKLEFQLPGVDFYHLDLIEVEMPVSVFLANCKRECQELEQGGIHVMH